MDAGVGIYRIKGTGSMERPSSEGGCILNKKVAGASRQECEKWGGRFFANRQEAEQVFQAEESEKLMKARARRWFSNPGSAKKNDGIEAGIFENGCFS